MHVALLTLGDPERISGGSLFDRRLAEHAHEHHARVQFFAVPEAPFPLPVLAAPATLRSVRRARPDVLVVDSIAAAAVAPWMQAMHVPATALIHQSPGGVGRNPIGAWLDRAIYRQMRLLMPTGQSLAEELTLLGIPLCILTPGRDTPVASEGARDLRGDRRVAILSVANWLPAKGIAELLDAFARLPTELATLHLVGDAPDRAYARRIRQRLAADDGLSERVVVHGSLPPERVAGMYLAADLFALPSYSETYGMAWAEAMDAGLPVVGWRATNLPHLVEHEREGLLVAPGDIAGLGRALQRLAEDEPMRRRLGDNARRRASSRPTWDETAAAFFSALRSVIA